MQSYWHLKLTTTAATRSYQAGLDKQLIMETTGHQNLDGIRYYKRTSDEQQQVVSDILFSAKKPRNECSEPTDISSPEENQTFSWEYPAKP